MNFSLTSFVITEKYVAAYQDIVTLTDVSADRLVLEALLPDLVNTLNFENIAAICSQAVTSS